MLVHIFDRLGILDRHLLQFAGQKSLPPFEPYPRPHVAARNVSEDRRRRRHDALVARLYRREE